MLVSLFIRVLFYILYCYLGGGYRAFYGGLRDIGVRKIEVSVLYIRISYVEQHHTFGSAYTVFTRLNVHRVYFQLGIVDPAFIWNPNLAWALYSWSNGFSSIIFTDIYRSVICAANYTSNKYLRFISGIYLRSHLGYPGVLSPAFNRVTTVLSFFKRHCDSKWSVIPHWQVVEVLDGINRAGDLQKSIFYKSHHSKLWQFSL